MTYVPPATHYVPYDTPTVRGRGRAVCGAMTPREARSHTPTCPDCTAYLTAADQESVESRFGEPGDAPRLQLADEFDMLDGYTEKPVRR